MSNTTHVKHLKKRAHALLLALTTATVGTTCLIATDEGFTATMSTENHTATTSAALSSRQQAIIPIAAFAAAGDMPNLNSALHSGLDNGLTISEQREVLVQVYAYAGFPRSLNALGELMKVVEARKKKGIQDPAGNQPGAAIPVGNALLEAGAANQTKLAGAPVKGPLFDFAPAIDQYLKTHLFGDIFERDNLDWQSRELATVSMLSVLPGVESQLQSHFRISMNVGLTESQLREVGRVLSNRVGESIGQRASEALDRQLAVAREN